MGSNSIYDKGVTSASSSPVPGPVPAQHGCSNVVPGLIGSTYDKGVISPSSSFSPGTSPVPSPARAPPVTTPGVLLAPDERDGSSHHFNGADFTQFAQGGVINYAQTSFFSPSSPQIR